LTPLVSVIIPAYNAEKFIVQTILSAQSQTYEPKEIIIVDDGSSDGTLALASQFASKDVRVFTQANKGASAARNKGLGESRGDYIQYLDADDLLADTKIEKQLEAISNCGDDFVYAGKWKVFFQYPDELSFQPNVLWKYFNSPIEWLITAWSLQAWMHPSAWLTPRHLIDKAGPWDESLSLHDDGEFFCRVLLQSKGVRFCKDAESYYRKGINDSLSSTLSPKAIESHYKICQLYERHLLGRRNSDETRKACAVNYLAFYYTYYPRYQALRLGAKDAAARLGLVHGLPQGTELFHILKKLFGWKLARRMENMYYGNGFNRASIIAKLKKLKLIRD
jgi:glycosyltransferase involved in cell wall biosynthesis